MSDAPHLADGVGEPVWLRWSLTAITVAFMAVFLLLPLVNIFHAALAEGWKVVLASLRDENAAQAIRLSLLSTVAAVLISGIFGLAAAWLLGRHKIPGHGLWVAILDLPFAISPVVAGLMFVLLCGQDGWLGPWFDRHGIQIIFAKPGIVLATAFVTFPFVARELLPLVQGLGPESEEAAQLLGATPWQTFWRVTLPALKWGLLYGVILCASRAMGEFGAVSVVSGHIRGETMTLPLHIEATYNEYQFSAAFACAALLSLMALVSLALKAFVAWRARRDRESL
jgi:sulfate transport system permease protein